MGINTNDCQEMIPEPVLCDRMLTLCFTFDMVRDGILYSIIGDKDVEDSALLLVYDLYQQKVIREYPFRYDSQQDFYPYRVLTDELMLSFNYETGTFALRNMMTGDITPLPVPGICIYGNQGQSDWYDISAMNIQTDPIILDHVFSDGRTVKAYITIDELLDGNPQIHDYISGDRTD